MVCIITGPAESERNSVGKLLAEELGWEFVEAKNLRPPGNRDAHRGGTAMANADASSRMETLSAWIELWLYEWRDIVVSCAVTERDRRQLSDVSQLVKIVSLEESYTTGRSRVLNRSVSVASSASPAACDAKHTALSTDASRQIQEIVAKITAMLIIKELPSGV